MSIKGQIPYSREKREKEKEKEAGRQQASWQADRLAGWQAGRLAGWQAGRLACDRLTFLLCYFKHTFDFKWQGHTSNGEYSSRHIQLTCILSSVNITLISLPCESHGLLKHVLYSEIQENSRPSGHLMVCFRDTHVRG